MLKRCPTKVRDSKTGEIRQCLNSYYSSAHPDCGQHSPGGASEPYKSLAMVGRYGGSTYSAEPVSFDLEDLSSPPLIDFGNISISKDILDEAKERTLAQEAIYGHNGGHFKLETEKENTLTGNVGEIITRDYLSQNRLIDEGVYEIELSDLGAPADLKISSYTGKTIGAHVKTGLYRSFPSQSRSFGIHASQSARIQAAKESVIVVSLTKGSDGKTPVLGKIEGFITSGELARCPTIKKGERFPAGYVSRTDNVLTTLSDYQSITIFEEKINRWANHNV